MEKKSAWEIARERAKKFIQKNQWVTVFIFGLVLLALFFGYRVMGLNWSDNWFAYLMPIILFFFILLGKKFSK